MTDREQYTPGPASGAQVRKGQTGKTSGRSSWSANCATRPKKCGRRLPTRRICASGRPSSPMGAWVRLER